MFTKDKKSNYKIIEGTNVVEADFGHEPAKTKWDRVKETAAVLGVIVVGSLIVHEIYGIRGRDPVNVNTPVLPSQLNHDSVIK